MDLETNQTAESLHAAEQDQKLSLEIEKLRGEIAFIPKNLAVQSRNGILVALAAFMSLIIVGIPQIVFAYRTQQALYSQNIANLIITAHTIKDDGERGRILRNIQQMWPEDPTLKSLIETNQPLTEQLAGDDTALAGSSLPINASKEQVCDDVRLQIYYLEKDNAHQIDEKKLKNIEQLKKALERKIDRYRCP